MKKRWALLFCSILILFSCRWLPQGITASPTPGETENIITAINHTPSPLQEPTFPQTVTPTTPLTPEWTAEPSPTVQPTWEWQRSSPEAQGVSSETLAVMLELIRQENSSIHSIVVVRHGVIILEAYVYPFNSYTRHGVYSVTKSFTSTLVGLAIGNGLIRSTNTPVYTFFPGIDIDDRQKETIQIEHLLTMTSGIEWMEPLHSGLNDHWYILESGDPAQYFFTPAVVKTPGTVYNYNSGGSHMLSIIVQEVVGKTAEEYAAERLFLPLDIRDYTWKRDFSGHTQGGTGLELLPIDMAKLGQVFLDNGQWQGNQIVPADWVSEATRAHSSPSPDMGYGYQWWVRPKGDYYALGWGGQQIRVLPAQDMVVVFTAGMGGQEMLHDNMVDTYLIPAVISDEALPSNPDTQAHLDAAIENLANPQTGPSYPLSPLASEINGKEWLVTGRGDWSMFTLHFSGEDEAMIDLTLDNGSMPLAVGLDGIFRVTDTADYGPIALYGYWETEDTFVLVQQNLREADQRETRLQFNGGTVKLYSKWFVEPYEEESEAELFGN